MLASKEMMTNEYNDSFYGKITENINDLFAPFEKYSDFPYIILIEGFTGIGKTTICKEIALQWARKIILKKKVLLFLLSLSDPHIESLTNVELLVKYFFQSDTIASKLTEWLTATDGKYLTIIIDGYSETSKNSFINDDIIGRKLLTQCNLIITSSAASLHLHMSVNLRVLVLGFTKSNQVTFIDNALQDSDIIDPRKYLQTNSVINSLCHVPLFMNILLWYAQEGISNLPKIQASLIARFIMTITKEKNVTTVTDLPHLYDQVIMEISRLAFITLQEDIMTFTVDEITDLYKNDYSHGQDFIDKISVLGLLNVISFEVDSFFYEIIYFIDVTIQEYLAAYYISQLPDSELFELLLETFWNNRYVNVWIMYIGINGGKAAELHYFLCSNEILRTSSLSIETPYNLINYQLQCLKEADGNLDDTLLGQIVYLKHQKLSDKNMYAVMMLLSSATNKEWKNLNLSHCNIDSQCCAILSEMFHSTTELRFDTVDISYNNLDWESFPTVCSILKLWHTNKIVFSIDILYDATTTNIINRFTNLLDENFQDNVYADDVLLLTYLPNQCYLIAVYSAPVCIRWHQWSNCSLNKDIIKLVKTFVKSIVRNARFKIVFSYSIVNRTSIYELLQDFQNVQLCGSYLHSKGAYLLNIDSKVDCQYFSPQELIADYFAMVLCQNIQSKTPYLESLSETHATAVKNTLQDTLSIHALDISHNFITSQIATEIAIVLLFTSSLQAFYASNNNLLEESVIKIAKSLQNISNLTILNISNNNIGGEAAGEIATVLSENIKLQILNLQNNSIKTAGIIKIAKALKNCTSLTWFNISNNIIGEEAADYIATVLSQNTKLQELYFANNSLKTMGMVRIAKALQNLSTLIVLDISNNNINEESADDIARVLSNNNRIQKVDLQNNNFKTEGMIKIAKALRNSSSLTWFNINNNDVGEEAADDIAAILYQNTKLQILDFQNNNLKTEGMIKIAEALKFSSSLRLFNINNNNVGDKAAHNIATVLYHNRKLSALDIQNNRFSIMGMSKIVNGLKSLSSLTSLSINKYNAGEVAADNIAAIVSQNSKLKILDLQNNNFKTAGMIKIARALKRCSSLTLFSINNNDVGEEAAEDLGVVFSQNLKLQKLDLQNNNFKTLGMMKIAKALQNISSLTWLSINHNGVGEEAADDIAAVLSQNINMQTLGLQNNNFKTRGMIKIANGLKNSSSLTWFSINNNSVGEEAADDIARVLSQNTKLKTLDLQRNNFKTKGMIKIAKALQDSFSLTWFIINDNNVGEEAAGDIATVLSQNTNLQVLDLQNNNFKTEGMIKIVKALRNCPSLTLLSINNNDVGDEAADDIAIVLYQNSKLQKLDLQNNCFKTNGMIKIAKALKK